jgi:predicted O-methyltransferase YrrM
MDPNLINHILAGAAHVLRDRRAESVLDSIYYESQVASDEAKELELTGADAASAVDRDSVITDFGYSLRPQQGELLYLLARASCAPMAVEFASSGGATAIYLAAAMRDNGGGLVIGSDHRPERIDIARRHVGEAGLSEYVEFRVGEPAVTLAEVGGPVALAYVDGWPDSTTPSRARRALEVLEPQLRSGAVIINENQEPDYVAYVRSPDNEYRTSASPLGLLSVFG